MPPDNDTKRYRILVCVDGTEEADRAVRYAGRMGLRLNADIVLLYVRQGDRGMRSGGLQVRVARENMLNWGIELPGTRYLTAGRDLLIEEGVMSADWVEKASHVEVAGDPLGDNSIIYSSGDGSRMIGLKLKVASDVLSGIVEQWEIGQYDLIVVGASERWRTGKSKTFWDRPVVGKLVNIAPCSVLIAREFKDQDQKHLLCTDGSKYAADILTKVALLSRNCGFPISVMTVAEEENKGEAEEQLTILESMLEAVGIRPEAKHVATGDVVDEIKIFGANADLIALAASARSPVARLLLGGVPDRLIREADGSVLIAH